MKKAAIVIAMIIVSVVLVGRKAYQPSVEGDTKNGDSGVVFSQSGPTSTPTAGPWHFQMEEVDAKLMSFEQWPRQFEGASYEIRLIPMSRANILLGKTDNNHSPNNPVWMVGLLSTNGVELGSISDPVGLGEPSTPGSNSSLVAGIYFVWNANTGDLISKGSMHDDLTSRLPQYLDLVAEPSQSLSITTPSPMPTNGPRPNHTPDS